MSEVLKKAVLKTLVEDQIVQLMVKSQTTNIFLEDGTTTLAAKLADIVADLATKPTKTEMEEAIEAMPDAAEVQGMIDTSVSSAIDALIDGAPETYDTLKEIADYLATHASEYEALTALVNTKVDKVEGKGLSTEDFTTELKNKLESLSNYSLEAATATKLGGVKIGSNIGVTEDGVISVADASTTTKGVVQLSDSVESTSSTVAATSKAVKAAYDKAVAKSDFIVSASQPENLRAGDLWVQLLD